jgi:multidrug efflux pump subunit AcrA (membrane-fusion protein)
MKFKLPYKKLFALVPILLGIAAFAWQNRNESEAPTVEVREAARPLRVLTVTPRTVVPEIRGYGVVEPGRTWRAVARVEGRVLAVHERLEAGSRVDAGSVLVELEAAPYELEIRRIAAEIARHEAELSELALREENDRASLAIENDSLELIEAELARLEALLESGTISTSEVDGVRRSVLGQRQSVQALKSNLALAPAQRAAKEALLESQRAGLEQARLDLTYTRLVAPFELVLGPVALEIGQFVGRGEVLFETYGIDRAVVDAEFLYGEARRVFGPESAARLAAAMAVGPTEPLGILGELFTADVTMTSGELRVVWDAHVVGLRELVDSSSRALALRVAVDRPFERAVPGIRPPLLQGTFCEVALRGLPLPDRLVVPRTAVLGGEVWVLDGENRMRSRSVVVEFEQAEAAVVASGLEPGDRVLVSDPGPALEGSLVDPTEDELAAAALARDLGDAGEDGR